MIEKILEIDLQVFTMINGLGSPYLDHFMIFMSDKYVWIPFYLFLIFKLYQKYGRSFYLYLIIIAVIVLINDQLIANFIKPFIGRLRPCKDPLLEGIVINIGKCVGKYSFVSAHSANTFALATFYQMVYNSTISKLLFAWATIVALSRVYLGVHFPTDIIAGAVLGVFLAWAIVKLLLPIADKIKAY